MAIQFMVIELSQLYWSWELLLALIKQVFIKLHAGLIISLCFILPYWNSLVCMNMYAIGGFNMGILIVKVTNLVKESLSPLMIYFLGIN